MNSQRKAQLSDPQGRISCSGLFDEAAKHLEYEKNWKIEVDSMRGCIMVTLNDSYCFHAASMESAIKWLLKAFQVREDGLKESTRSLQERLRNVQSENNPVLG